MNGMPFMQTAHAVDVTRLGARLVDLFCLPEIGEITIQHGSQKARYKIAWTGTMGGGEAGQVGLRLLEPEKNIWGKSLSKRSAGAEPSVETGEHSGHASEVKGGNGASGSGASAAVAAAPVYARKRMHLWATLTKISASGFYAETPSPLPTDTAVNVTLRTLVGQIRANGITRSSHPNAGMGIGFINLNGEDRSRLGRFIEQVMKNNDPTFGLGVAMIEAVEPERAQPKSESPKLPKKAVAPALSPEKIADNAKLTARLHSLIKELRELQEVVNSAGLDHRVTRSFQNSVTHTHQSQAPYQSAEAIERAAIKAAPLLGSFASTLDRHCH